MFSQTAEYALRAIAYLAVNRTKLNSSQEIARATQVPAGYLSKVLKDLVDSGIVSSQRGPTGGFGLRREPDTLTVLDVINAVDPIRRITACPLGIPSHGTRLCRLHRKLDEAIAVVQETLGAARITDLVKSDEVGVRALFPTGDAVKVSVSAKGRRSPRA